MPLPAHPGPGRPGFTLIELLIVISIIAVLSSMLMVAVRLVRGSALNAKCVSNQRNLAIALQAYCTDNDGLLPYRNVNTEWPNLAVNYLEGQYQNLSDGRNNVFHCPFADREITNVYTFATRFSAHYGMNGRIRVLWLDTGWANGQPPLAIASLPANLVLLTENQAWVGGSGVYFEDSVDFGTVSGPWPVALYGAGGTVAPIIWHAKSINFICIDGHTERVTGSWDQAAMASRFIKP